MAKRRKKGRLNNSSAASLSVPEMGYRHREVVVCVWGLIIELMDEEEDDVDGSSSRQTTGWCLQCLRVHVCEYSLSFSNCEGVVSTMWVCFCVCVCVCVVISGSQLEQIHRKTDCVKAVPCISATCSLQLDCRSSFNTTNTFSVRIKTIDLQALQPQLVHHCYCALKHGTLVYLTSKCWCCSHNIIIKAAPGPSLELV